MTADPPFSRVPDRSTCFSSPQPSALHFSEPITRFGALLSQFTRAHTPLIPTNLSQPTSKMRSTAILLSAIALATTALAEDKCAAQNIVDACVEGYQHRIEGCQKNANDWICMCDVYTDVLTCYNNCPDSNMKPPVQNQVTQYCTAAEPYVFPKARSKHSASSLAE
jgi:hypothetical protein